MLIGAALVLSDHPGAALADGFLDFLFAPPAAPAEPTQGSNGSLMLQQPYRHRRHAAREDGGVSFVAPRRPRRSASDDAPRRPRRTGSDDVDAANGATASGHRSICVRLCDGYPFPIGHYGGSGDRAAQEATCRSECPGAETALYLVPGASDSVGDAVSVASNERYSKLPAAFKYQTALMPACTCHPPGGAPVRSLLRDFTLRRGDVVMTPSGFRVFHGDARFPYRQADFVTLARSSDIHRPVSALLVAMEKPSLLAAPHPARARQVSFDPNEHVLTVHQ